MNNQDTVTDGYGGVSVPSYNVLFYVPVKESVNRWQFTSSHQRKPSLHNTTTPENSRVPGPSVLQYCFVEGRNREPIPITTIPMTRGNTCTVTMKAQY